MRPTSRLLLAVAIATALHATDARAAKVVWSSRDVHPRPRPASPDSAAVRDSLAARARAAARDSVAARASAAARDSAARDSAARALARSRAAAGVSARRDSAAARAPAAPAAGVSPVAPAAVPPAPRAETPSPPPPAPAVAPELPAAAPAPARASAGRREARISYLAGRSAYIDAGQSEGLSVGDTVNVLRDGGVFARLRASFVSTHRASCDTLWTRAPLAIGDPVTFRADARRQAAAQDSLRAVATRGDSLRAAAVLPAPRDRAATRSSRLRGRAGARWLSVQSDGGSRFQQPGVELRLDGRDGLDGHLDAALDIRGRRTVMSSTNGSSVDQLSRVYRASATLRDREGHRRITFGRQSSPTLASISLFDGALVEWAGERTTFGTFGGTQPDPLRYRWSSELVEGGLFAEWHQRPLAARRWSVSTGAVTSRAGNQVNRDFMFAQGWWFSKGASASLAQEVDVNSGWKRALGEPAVSWTSTFATLRVPVTPQLALESGYDNRRNVRLWRDRETPETDFDDRYRQGAWAGASYEWQQHLRTTTEYRTGSGSDHSDTWSWSGEARRFTRWQAGTRLRWSRFTSPGNESRLLSFGAGLDPLPQSHLELTAGTRTTRDRIVDVSETDRWQGVDLDVAVGGRWYVNGSYELQRGAAGSTRQLQAGLSVRL